MKATGAAVVQGHCAVRNVDDGVLPGELAPGYPSVCRTSYVQ